MIRVGSSSYILHVVPRMCGNVKAALLHPSALCGFGMGALRAGHVNVTQRSTSLYLVTRSWAEAGLSMSVVKARRITWLRSPDLQQMQDVPCRLCHGCQSGIQLNGHEVVFLTVSGKFPYVKTLVLV